MRKMKKFFALLLALAMIASLAACSGTDTEEPAEGGEAQGGEAQGETLDYPKDDITIIVPFDAGGGNDIVGRVIAKVAMENGYFNGVNFIVENQPGGGGAIGQGYVANTAEPDGYTLLAYTASVITNCMLKDVPFTVDDLKIIVCMNADPAVMIARPDAPFDDVDGLLEYAKSNSLIINDSGFGTSSHLRTLDWTTKLEEQTGQTIEYQAIHSDSGNMQITELMGGHADVTCLTAGECADAILSGNVKAIGIMTDERFEGLPDVPTFAEQGYEGFIDGADRAIACSSDVPEDIYNYLVEEFTRLCSSQEFIDAMNASNLTPACKSADEYQEFIDGKVELITQFEDVLLAGE